MKTRKTPVSLPSDAVASVKELNESIDRFVSMKPLLQRLAKIMADYEKLTIPKMPVALKKSNGKSKCN